MTITNPIIFVDIDGVLQPFTSTKRHRLDCEILLTKLSSVHHAISGIDTDHLGGAYYDWDAQAMQILYRLCNGFDAQIVISSSWRRSLSLEQLRALFSLHGLGEKVLDVLPILEFGRGGPTRADEIDEWITKQQYKGPFVILDDDYTEEYSVKFPQQFVLVPGCLGFEQENQAKNILSIING